MVHLGVSMNEITFGMLILGKLKLFPNDFFLDLIYYSLISEVHCFYCCQQSEILQLIPLSVLPELYYCFITSHLIICYGM